MGNAQVVRHHHPSAQAQVQRLAQSLAKHGGVTASQHARLDANGRSPLLNATTQLRSVDLVTLLTRGDQAEDVGGRKILGPLDLIHVQLHPLVVSHREFTVSRTQLQLTEVGKELTVLLDDGLIVWCRLLIIAPVDEGGVV